MHRTRARRATRLRLPLLAATLSALSVTQAPSLEAIYVDFWYTVELARLLREKGDVVVETLVFPDEVHSFLLHRNWLEAFRTSDRFLERHLAPRTAARGGR